MADIFAALASCELGVVCATVDGRFLDVNPSFCTMLGYTREELLGRNVAEITHPDDVPGTVKRRAKNRLRRRIELYHAKTLSA